TREETRGCFLDSKINKYDLRRSLAAGDLCNACRRRFDEHANPEVRAAFKAMAQEVARLGFAASADAIAIRPDYTARRDKLFLNTGQKDSLTRGRKRHLFISYSHADERECQRLEIHLKVLCRKNFIEPWHARCIPAGADWASEIDERLDAA